MELSEYQVMAAVEQRHWWYGGMRAISAALIESVYPVGSKLRILDAGCGSAGNAPFLRRYGDVVGVDLEPVALRYGQRHLPGRVACASVLALPYANESFDLVTSFDVLYHARVANEAAALHEIWRVLRPGGRLLIRLPAFEWLKSRHDRAVHTRRRYQLGEVRAMLTAAGFAVERASYANCFLFLPRVTQHVLQVLLPSLDQQHSDLELSDGVVNELLRLPLAAEAFWLAGGGTLPVGTSALCLATKEYRYYGTSATNGSSGDHAAAGLAQPPGHTALGAAAPVVSPARGNGAVHRLPTPLYRDTPG